MFFAKACVRGTSQWKIVTNFGEIFLAEKGILEYMVEKMQEKHPDIEYVIEEFKN